ncbi:MAG: DUF4340 domain-containing protein [Alphaproteobacteria bacterium]|nr:DUF4340 domain-containing protein [Alphaproteobacteria bacterium]
MNMKHLYILGGLAVAGIAANAVVYSTSPQRILTDKRGVTLFPDLIKRANEVAAITVQDKDASFTVERRENGFFDQASGYPVKPELFRDLVAGAATLAYEEAKTADEARHGDLGLADPLKDKTDKAGRVVTLRDGKGGILAQFIAGNRDNTVGGARGGQFVRLLNDRQSWLARGGVNVPVPHTAWFEINLINLNKDALARVEITGGGIDDIYLDATKKGDDLKLLNAPPEGRKADNNKALRVAFMVDPISFDGVRKPQGEVKPDARKLVAKGHDGIEITLTVIGDLKERWVRISAKGTNEESSKKAAELSAKVDGFEFQLIDRYAEVLGWKLEDFTEEAKS